MSYNVPIYTKPGGRERIYDEDASLTMGANTTFACGGTASFTGGTSFNGLIETDAAGGATSTNGLLLGNGTTGDPCLNSAADKHFVSLYMKHAATSGDNRGIYTSTEFAGVGGGGDGIRSNTIVNAAGCGTVQGIHGSVENKSGGKVTGLGVGVRAGYLFANEAVPAGGTYAGGMSELWATGPGTDVSPATIVSLHRMVLGGDATGRANIDANCYAFEFAGMTPGSGNLINTGITTHTPYGGLAVYIDGVGVKHLALVSD
jgi:hypothetical protein